MISWQADTQELEMGQVVTTDSVWEVWGMTELFFLNYEMVT